LIKLFNNVFRAKREKLPKLFTSNFTLFTTSIVIVLQPLHHLLERLELYVFVADLEALGLVHHESVYVVELAGFVFLVLTLTGEAAVSPIRCGGVLAPGAVVQ